MALLHILATLYLISQSAAIVVKTGDTPNATDKGNFELLILHNNDMHARFEQTSQLSGSCTPADRDAGKCYGGFPRVAYVVKKARAAAAAGEGPPVLYLNAGDTYTGTAWFTIYKWKIAAEFINALQPDAVSLGNHEFDEGISGLTPFIKNLTCPVLAANLNLNAVPELQAETNLMKSIIFNIDGTKVGVIGYLTPETKVLAVANDVEYMEEVIALRQEVKKLKKENCSILIALGHSGFAKDLEIAKEVEDIDLVIGGHTNTFLWNGRAPDSENPEGPYPTLVKQPSGRNVLVVQAYAYTKYLGKLHLVFDSNGEIVKYDGMPVLLNNTIPQDREVLSIIDRYDDEVLKITEKVVGNTSVFYDFNVCKTKECNLGNMVTDAIVYKYASEYDAEGWTDAPIAIMQRGGIRASIIHNSNHAEVTYGDLLTVLPFNDKIAKVTIDGSNILNMLEYSVWNYNPVKSSGSFLHFSGMKVIYDMRGPPGGRVSKVKILCGKCNVPEYQPLEKSKKYNILMTSFLKDGGDGYYMFHLLPAITLEYTDLEAATEYVKNRSPLYTAIDGRIIIENFDKMSSSVTSSAVAISVGKILLLILSIFTFCF